jgi:hypothetical protein
MTAYYDATELPRIEICLDRSLLKAEWDPTGPGTQKDVATIPGV